MFFILTFPLRFNHFFNNYLLHTNYSMPPLENDEVLCIHCPAPVWQGLQAYVPSHSKAVGNVS